MKIEKITPQIAALYLGQKCDINPEAGFEVIKESFEPEIGTALISHLKAGHLTITPHLRRLESITEDEAKHLFTLESDVAFEESIYATCFGMAHQSELEWAISQFKHPLFFNPHQSIYLLSRGFDLFNLIDLGLAKEITTQTNEL